MEFFEAIDTRRTVRDFIHCDIDDETIEKIIRAGLKAPTNDHMRDWHFVVVKDKSVVMRLLSIVRNGISEEDMLALIRDWNLNDAEQQACYRDAVPKQHRMLADASAVIIPLLKQKTDILGASELSQLNGFASIWCCVENIFLAAAALGYGCNLRIPVGNESAWSREVLGYPEDYMMPCFIGLGLPDSSVKPIKQKDIAVGDRIHKDKW